ncbi:MAG: RpiB/LacA/LacB family sugar-phosphate isomerase [Bacteroidota bacterium]
MIYIGSDHGGYLIKEHIKTYLTINKIDFEDCGTNSELSVDYPEFAHKVANSVSGDLNNSLGILVCGSGNGVNITANKHKNIRCALCWNSEIAALAKQHNNANIIALPGRYISTLEAEKIIHTFLNSTFEAGRHQNRINLIENE